MEKGQINRRLNKFSNILNLDLSYFARGSFWLISSILVTTAGGFFLSYLYANLVPKDVFGQYSFLLAILGAASIFGLPGMSQVVSQASSENKDGVFKLSIIETAKWSILGLFALIAISLYYFLKGNNVLAIAVIVSAAAFPITTAGSLYNSFFNGKKLFNLTAICSTVAQLLSIGAIALALLYSPSLIFIALVSAWSTTLINAFFTFFAFKYVSNKNKDKKLVKMGIHLSFSQIFTITADYLDRILIPIFLGFTSNAIYSFAILIPNQMHAFFKMFTTLAQPKITEMNKKDFKKNLLLKSLQLEVLIILIVSLLILLTPYIFEVLFPTYTGDAVFPSQLASLSLLYFPGNLLALGLLKGRQTKSLAQINAAYGIFTIIFLLFFVPQYGIMGAVVAKILVRFIQVIMQIFSFLKLNVEDIYNPEKKYEPY